MNHVVALSGGKDSTAMALRLAEVEPRDYTYICTPTGNELPEMKTHWTNLERLLDAVIVTINSGATLDGLINIQKALPNNRMRWCTRMLKIEPAIAFYRKHAPCVAYVGLRADEDADERTGIYGIEIEQRYPMREWGWTESDVWDYLFRRGVSVPERTDCAWCYDQQLRQWRRLWQSYPHLYWAGDAHEKKIGHTFRSPSRDTWPASLQELAKEFSKGRIPRGADDQLKMFDAYEARETKCRVCSM